MKLLLKKVPDLIIPSQANPPSDKEAGDAGYDITATTDPIIRGEYIERPIDTLRVWRNVIHIEYGTNLYVAPDCSREDFHLEVLPRSSISKYNLTLANSVGLIDAPYRGQICLRFSYRFQPEDLVIVPEAGVQRIYGIVNPEKIYQKNDKIGQLVGRKTIGIEFFVSDNLPDTKRGEGGFGSSDQK
jgi:dUTP pyrophosphatase